MDKQTMLYEMAQVFASLVCGFTGDVKEGMDIIKLGLTELYLYEPERNHLIDAIEEARDQINQFNVSKAASILSPVQNKLWSDFKLTLVE